MTPLTIAALCLAMVGTSFLSGIFGMAGGMILVGILLVMMPVPEAMMLHGVTQLASNGWRGLLWWRYVRPGAAVTYIIGCLVAPMIGATIAGWCRSQASASCESVRSRAWAKSPRARSFGSCSSSRF